MTKSELIEQLTVDNDVLNKREAELIVNSIFDSIGQALIEGDRVEIRGFGSFTVRERGMASSEGGQYITVQSVFNPNSRCEATGCLAGAPWISRTRRGTR